MSTLKWIKDNLFSSYLSGGLTLICVWVLYTTIPSLLNWLIINANFTGNTPEACNRDGACWVFIKTRFNQFMYGFYPIEHRWRVNSGITIGTINLVLLLLPRFRYKFIALFSFIFIYPFIAYILFFGGFGLTVVKTSLWGGLHLTLVIATCGIIMSLPLGILLALARNSQLTILKTLAITFIELWRGVPLISVLFMASVMLPLFLPAELEFNKLLRALIGVGLFSSAYMAEVIRGGLQAIPKNQFEAAYSIGLNYIQSMRLIVLPQSLKIVIPGIVNTFIGLFKDTTLVLIIGLFDLLGMVQAANTDPNWLAYNVEGYIFAAFGFWIFCFAMSKYSQSLEGKK